MEGYLHKMRYYTCGKQGNMRRRYCMLDLEKDKIMFKTTKEENKVHKQVKLEEIASVVENKENGFIAIFRHTATSELSGAAFLFQVKDDGRMRDLTVTETRDIWVNKLRLNVNANNNGLDLMNKMTESIHTRYKVLVTPKNLLGKGMNGDVRRIIRKHDNKPFAMKTISLSKISKSRCGAMRREIDILKSLDHPHIARLLDTFIEPKLYCRLVLEVCEGGELFQRLNRRHHFSERYAGKLLCTMLYALNYLHLNRIVHRDLKLENWLFWKKESYEKCHKVKGNQLKPADCGCIVCEDSDLALIDFGLSRRFRDESETMIKQLGTCYYVAPEVLKGRYHNTTCDMWSLGVIAFMLLSGKAPFDADKDEDITRKVLSAAVPNINEPSKASVWSSVSSDCKDFVLSLLKKDPTKRLTARDALQHPWIKSILDLTHKIHSEESKSSHMINDSILERLKNFTKYKELKRLAMEVIAYSLDHNEIKELTDLFEHIDSDHDGYIGLDELVDALQDYENLDRSEIEKIFEALDEEHNGKVHVNEFVAGALQARYHLEEHFLHEAFERLDYQHKGKVTKADLVRVLGKCGSHDRIMDIWEKSGKKEDEFMSFEEFMAFMRSDGEKDIRKYTNQLEVENVDVVELSEVEYLQKKKERIEREGTANVDSMGSRSRSTRLRTFKPFKKVRNMFRKSGIKRRSSKDFS